MKTKSNQEKLIQDIIDLSKEYITNWQDIDCLRDRLEPIIKDFISSECQHKYKQDSLGDFCKCGSPRYSECHSNLPKSQQEDWKDQFIIIEGSRWTFSSEVCIEWSALKELVSTERQRVLEEVKEMIEEMKIVDPWDGGDVNGCGEHNGSFECCRNKTLNDLLQELNKLEGIK